MDNMQRLDRLERSKDFSRSFMWPFIYTPILWVGLIHVATRFHWLLSKFGDGSVPPPH